MKIKFKRFAPTSTFLKLFGVGPNESARNTSGHEETGDVYEYYYKRGNTYYFRNSEGNKVSMDYKEPPNELLRGNKYKIEDLSNRDS